MPYSQDELNQIWVKLLNEKPRAGLDFLELDDLGKNKNVWVLLAKKVTDEKKKQEMLIFGDTGETLGPVSDVDPVRLPTTKSEFFGTFSREKDAEWDMWSKTKSW